MSNEKELIKKGPHKPSDSKRIKNTYLDKSDKDSEDKPKLSAMIFVEYGKVTAFDTGLKLADVIADPLENIMLEIKPRSGLAKNHGVIVLGGVVDSTYRGPIIVLLSSIIPGTKMEVNPGDRIAQMVIVKIENGIMARVEEAFETTETERGEKGFGSSGK
jgi:deoxyuridine 5'-triphosphate nucleotidohydrolase